MSARSARMPAIAPSRVDSTHERCGWPAARATYSPAWGQPKSGIPRPREGRTPARDAALSYVRDATSHPVVQLVLERVRALRERLDLLLALVLDPGLDELRGEHAACEQEVVVGLEGVEGLA